MYMCFLPAPAHCKVIARDKRGYPDIIFSNFFMKIQCGFSLEEPQQGASDEYPSMFSWRNKKNINTF